MQFDRREYIVLMLAGLGTPASAYELDYSMSRLARWRSFGVANWTEHDPFERSKPGAKRQPYDKWSLRQSASRTDQVLDLIGFAEAGRHQYEAVHMSADRRPKKRPSQMTLQEILNWIRNTPGQHHAIGRYQFIPSTLVSLANRAKAPLNTRFEPEIQDRLAYLLLRDAGYERFLKGEMVLTQLMDNLAWIWAGLPLRSGRSAYSGVAGNRATISRKFYALQMQRIFS